jgi:hypothetical protein
MIMAYPLQAGENRPSASLRSTDSLDVREEYACARPFSRASHLNVFEQPVSN